MDLIRLIKLKKLNGELDNLSEQETLLITLCDSLKYKNGFLTKNNDVYFLYRYENRTLYYSYKFVYEIFKKHYNFYFYQMDDLLESFLHNFLNIKNVSVRVNFDS